MNKTLIISNVTIFCCPRIIAGVPNKLTEEEQWAKLRLVQEVAREVWG